MVPLRYHLRGLISCFPIKKAPVSGAFLSPSPRLGRERERENKYIMNSYSRVFYAKYAVNTMRSLTPNPIVYASITIKLANPDTGASQDGQDSVIALNLL